ncbi:MAG TPA: serine hydrolase domain-containing protein, partial [Iamia sp.]|nr:serine hydrolase domain-containing protein [Iamia sp.]
MRHRLRRPLVATFLVAPLLVVLIGCGTDAESPPDDGGAAPPSDTACPGDVGDALAAWGAAGFSGSVVLTTDGAPVCEAAFGLADQDEERPNTVDTVFSIGSVSKAVTAAAVFALVDDGQLRLDQTAGEVLPELEGAAAAVTIEQLLLHTSGLQGGHGQDHEPLSRDDAIAAISGLESAFPPGTDSLYSNAGYTLLALVAEEASGRPYRDLIAERLLALPDGSTAGGFWDGEPAAPGPRAVGYHDDGAPGADGSFAGPHWALAGNGDVAMTMPQLAAWTHALFTGELLSADSTEAVARPEVDTGDGTAEAPGWVVFDEERFGEPVVASAGGGGDVGHEVVVAWLPDSERVFTIASNTPDVTAEALLEAIGPALASGDPLPRPDVPVDDASTPAERAVAAGTYVLDDGGRIVVADEDGSLHASADGVD